MTRRWYHDLFPPPGAARRAHAAAYRLIVSCGEHGHDVGASTEAKPGLVLAGVHDLQVGEQQRLREGRFEPTNLPGRFRRFLSFAIRTGVA
jgi:hypothetical protein